MTTDPERFSDEVREAASRLASPVQTGSFAWQVMGSRFRRYYVHTDARFVPPSRKALLSFADCTCPAGKHTTGSTSKCSHVLRVLQSICDQMFQSEESE